MALDKVRDWMYSHTMMNTYPTHDHYGKSETPGLEAHISDRMEQRFRNGTRDYIHRAKNGAHDPFTHYHILNTLLHIRPDELFRALDLVEYLRENNPQLAWDSVTVGRVLMDLTESLRDATPTDMPQPIRTSRRWNGNNYVLNRSPEAKLLMLRLLDDLRALCDTLVEQERQGIRVPRTTTPLLECPSVAL